MLWLIFQVAMNLRPPFPEEQKLLKWAVFLSVPSPFPVFMPNCKVPYLKKKEKEKSQNHVKYTCIKILRAVL